MCQYQWAETRKKSGTSQYFNTLRCIVFSVLNLPSRAVPEGAVRRVAENAVGCGIGLIGASSQLKL